MNDDALKLLPDRSSSAPRSANDTEESAGPNAIEDEMNEIAACEKEKEALDTRAMKLEALMEKAPTDEIPRQRKARECELTWVYTARISCAERMEELKKGPADTGERSSTSSTGCANVENVNPPTSRTSTRACAYSQHAYAYFLLQRPHRRLARTLLRPTACPSRPRRHRARLLVVLDLHGLRSSSTSER